MGAWRGEARGHDQGEGSREREARSRLQEIRRGPEQAVQGGERQEGEGRGGAQEQRPRTAQGGPQVREVWRQGGAVRFHPAGGTFAYATRVVPAGILANALFQVA